MKGKTNNPNGRPKGIPNKSTTQIRELITKFIDNNIERLQSDFDKLDAKDRLLFFEKLLPYVLSKQKEVGADTNTTDATPITIIQGIRPNTISTI